MRLKEYINYLNEIVKKDKKALNLEVVYSCDDEGNRFDSVHYAPSIQDDLEDFNKPIICIN